MTSWVCRDGHVDKHWFSRHLEQYICVAQVEWGPQIVDCNLPVLAVPRHGVDAVLAVLRVGGPDAFRAACEAWWIGP